MFLWSFQPRIQYEFWSEIAILVAIRVFIKFLSCLPQQLGSPSQASRRPCRAQGHRCLEASKRQTAKVLGNSINFWVADGSQHSRERHPQDVESENSKFCQGIFDLPKGIHPRCGINICVFAVFEFLFQLPTTPEWVYRGRRFCFFCP